MATKPDDHVKQQEVLVGLQKSGTLKKATVVHVSPADTSAQGTNTNVCYSECSLNEIT